MNLFELAAKLTLDSSSYDSGIDSAKGKAETFGSKLKSGLATAGKVTAAAIGTATAAVTAFAKSSVESGMKFDTSMSQVAATMGTTVDQIQDLRDFAQEMGRTTAFSATQAADALNYMALAGYDADTSMSMLPNVLNLAAAGSMDLAAASDMITDSQSALGLTLDETSQLVDKMAKASSKSNTSVSQLGEAILTVGGTAKNLAGGTTELSTALGILADNGTKGAEGGTKLRNIILSLGAPTDTAAKALRDLGVDAYDTNGNLRPLQDTFSDLNKELSSKTMAERTDIINTIFNKTDIKDVNALLATSADRWDELSSAIDDSTGAAQSMANIQLDNLAGDITLFQSALEGAQIAVSDALTPALREFVQFGSDGLSRLTESFKEDGLAGAMDTFGEILSEGIDKISAWLPKAVSIGTDLLLTIIDGLVSALPSLGTAAIEIITNLANGLAAAAPDLIPAAYEAVTSFIMGISDPNSLGSIIDGAIAISMGLADGLIASIPILTENAPIIVENLTTAIIENTPKLLDAALELMLALAEGLIKNIPTILAAQGKIFVAIIEALIKFGIELFDWFAGLRSDIMSKIKSWFSEMISNVVAFIANLVSNIQSFLSDLPNKIGFALGYALGSIVKFGANAIQWARTTVPKIIDSIVTWFEKLPGRLANWLSATITNIIQFGVNMRAKAVSAAISTVTGIINIFTSLPGKMADIGGNIVKGLWKGINDMKNWVINKVKGFGNSVMAGIKSALGIASPSKITRGFGRFVSQGLALGIEDDEQKAVNAMESLSDSVKSAFDTDSILNTIGAIDGVISIDTSSITANVTPMSNTAIENRTERLLNQILDVLYEIDRGMYDKIANAIDGMEIDWNDRELGRFVKSYA